jgi:hypothetical protein
VLLDYFHELRTEINQRIGAHSTLVAAKIVTAGALFAFLLTQLPEDESDIRFAGLLLVPAVAALYDVLIAKNVKVIHEIATFIREVIEPELTRGTDLELWERWHNEHSEHVFRNYGRLDILLLTLFTVGTGLVAAGVLWDQGRQDWAVWTAIAVVVGGVLLAVLMNYLMVKKYAFGKDDGERESLLMRLRRGW